MKKTITSLCFILTIISAIAQSDRVGWKATIKVVDEDNAPVSNATVTVWYYVAPPPGETEAHAKIQGVTDANGVFMASNETNGSIDIGFVADKEGYYSVHAGHEFMKFKDSDPEKWDPHVTLLLKKIVDPIAMYAKSITFIKFPDLNKSIGYDLTVGDWVAPYGKGITADFMFTQSQTNAGSGYTFTIGFPNAGDGIQGYTRDWNMGVSGLLSSYEAPMDGYQSHYEQTKMPNPNRIYYFRVRTVLDSNGNILSARYGKIYGDFMQFTYYLNPTQNDRNVEFDTKHNLLGGLESFEQVRRP